MGDVPRKRRRIIIEEEEEQPEQSEQPAQQESLPVPGLLSKAKEDESPVGSSSSSIGSDRSSSIGSDGPQEIVAETLRKSVVQLLRHSDLATLTMRKAVLSLRQEHGDVVIDENKKVVRRLIYAQMQSLAAGMPSGTPSVPPDGEGVLMEASEERLEKRKKCKATRRPKQKGDRCVIVIDD
jgi:hypothetical protein